MESRTKKPVRIVLFVIALLVVFAIAFGGGKSYGERTGYTNGYISGYRGAKEFQQKELQESNFANYHNGYAAGYDFGLAKGEDEGYEHGYAAGYKAGTSDTVLALGKSSLGPSGRAGLPAQKEEPQSVTVYVTRYGSKYHRSGCRYLSNSQIPLSLSNAKSQGYDPCSVCSPPR